MSMVRDAVSERTPFGFRHFNELSRRYRADLAVKYTRFDYPSRFFAASQSVAPTRLHPVAAWQLATCLGRQQLQFAIKALRDKWRPSTLNWKHGVKLQFTVDIAAECKAIRRFCGLATSASNSRRWNAFGSYHLTGERAANSCGSLTGPAGPLQIWIENVYTFVERRHRRRGRCPGEGLSSNEFTL